MTRKRSKHKCPKCGYMCNHLHRVLITQEPLCYKCARTAYGKI